MSEDKVLSNEGVVETFEKVSYSKGNGLSKVVVVGVIITLGTAAVIFVKRMKAKKGLSKKPVANKVNSQKAEK